MVLRFSFFLLFNLFGAWNLGSWNFYSRVSASSRLSIRLSGISQMAATRT